MTGTSFLHMCLILAAVSACSSHHTVDSTTSKTVNGLWAGDRSGTARIQHVVMLSIDGLHDVDLTNQLENDPDSTLAKLSNVAVRYENVRAPFPSDSFPCVLAWATGGTPKSTGIYYDISYDRTLSAPGTDCSTVGTQVDLSEVADTDSDKLDGGGGLNEAKLPRDPSRSCAVEYPHDYLRVNTIFEVVKSAGLRTAWSDKHLAYEVLNGPSGNGVDDLYDPEIASINEKDLTSVAAYDQAKVDVIIAQIHGKDHRGNAAEVPALFGMNFQAVSTMQKLNSYMNADGAENPTVRQALEGIDRQLASIVDALVETNLWESTALIVGASHGQSPIDPSLVKRISTKVIPGLVNAVSKTVLASITQDAVALLWLTDSRQTDEVAESLIGHRDAAGIDHLITGIDLSSQFADPAKDSRVPDIIVVAKDGVIYTDSNKKVAEHGGNSDDDRKVGLMVVGGSPASATIASALETRQIAPTILTALGLDATQLQSRAIEPVDTLPSLVFQR
jgi:hypothetical protein